LRNISCAITATGKNKKMKAYENLAAEIMKQIGGFNIDDFKFKSNVEA